MNIPPTIPKYTIIVNRTRPVPNIVCHI